MPLTLTNSGAVNTYTLNTANNGLMANAANAGISFRFRLEGNPGTLASSQTLIQGQFATWFFTQLFTPVGSAISLRLQMLGATNATSNNAGMVGGTIYHVVMSWTPGAQSFYLNGSLVATSAQAGNLVNISGRPIQLFGLASSCPVTISNLALWNAYAPTATDAGNLFSGVFTPASLPNPAQAWWTLAGTPGAVANIGDPGLNDSIGSLHLATIAGTGTAVYASPFDAAPSPPTVLRPGRRSLIVVPALVWRPPGRPIAPPGPRIAAAPSVRPRRGIVPTTAAALSTVALAAPFRPTVLRAGARRAVTPRPIVVCQSAAAGIAAPTWPFAASASSLPIFDVSVKPTTDPFGATVTTTVTTPSSSTSIAVTVTLLYGSQPAPAGSFTILSGLL